MERKQLRGAILLLLTAFIWGVAFVAQTVGLESVGVFTFSGVRMLLGAAALLPVILIRDRITARKMTVEQLTERKKNDKRTMLYGAILGVVFCVASNFQQYSLLSSSPGKVAFITAIYIFFVPLLGLFLGKRVPLLTWICIALGGVGLYFLCINPAELGAINHGDILALICSIAFAVHILLIERFAPNADGLKLSFVQFVVGGLIGCILMFIFEDPNWNAIIEAAIPLLYAGVMSCGVAYTLQIIGQKYTESALASLIMCMESVFAVLAAAILLSDVMSARETIGCVIMFVAIALPNVMGMIQNRRKK
ncbi:MAG: DMT family transporter [Clostridia bacterium]|nr:DMT family transporter [Clostridia bacterium]